MIIFLPHPSSPARRGSTSPPKSSHPQEGGLKAWPAGPVLANKLSPLKGLLVVIDAIELRLSKRRGRGCATCMRIDDSLGTSYTCSSGASYFCNNAIVSSKSFKITLSRGCDLCTIIAAKFTTLSSKTSAVFKTNSSRRL